jgi:hypothetical protein
MNVTATAEGDARALSFAMTLSLVIGLLMFVIKFGAYGGDSQRCGGIRGARGGGLLRGVQLAAFAQAG